MKYRLGLDVGTNSLGWCVLQLDGGAVPVEIVNSGVRIFPEGRDPKSKSTLKATRRVARSARRRRDRYLQRRKYLLSELTKCGLFPQDKDERKVLQDLNPLELRKAALNQKLPLYHLGRSLFHLNQRRGFKSNRKDTSEEASSGKVSKSTRMLLEQMKLIEPQLSTDEYKKLTRPQKKEARQAEANSRNQAIRILSENPNLTYGSFLRNRQIEGKPTRARPLSDGNLYDVYPTRELIEDEFEKIWKSQSQYYPDTLTDKLKEKIKKIIFFQRPLKPQPMGKCTYFPDEYRTYRAMPSFQRYRMLQEVNNLEWSEGLNRERIIDHPSGRDALIDMLEFKKTGDKATYRNAQITFKKMRSQLMQMDVMRGHQEFNFESENRKGFDGNQTSIVMSHEDYVGPSWNKWALDSQDDFISIVLDDGLDDEDACAELVEKFGLSEAAASRCLYANLVPDTANISLKAARELANIMKARNKIQSDAVAYAAESVHDFVDPMASRRSGELLSYLPYYGKAVEGHIIPGHSELSDGIDEQTRIGMVSNPTVHIALNQIRNVVNELIGRYGRPFSIAIELGRDLPAGKEGRSEIEKAQKENQKENEKIDDKLIELGQIVNRENRLRVRLWNEQNFGCIFTGRIICISDLFSSDIEIEHLIPFSQSLDDSRANKVVCFRQANRDKGNRTPYQAFGHNPDTYDWSEVISRVKGLPKSKQWRFSKDALNIWNKESDFTSRHLNDTRYIGRLAKEYLENICPFNRIDVVTGRLTALLRHYWGLNSVLSQINPLLKGTYTKNRDDHRHHAVDAIVVGLTTRSIIQKVATVASQAELEDYAVNLFLNDKKGRGKIDPWDGFRANVIESIRNIIVSHKTLSKKLTNKSTDGQLHNETAFGLAPQLNTEEKIAVVTRHPISYFDTKDRLEKIRDSHLRNIFLNAFKESGKDGVVNKAKSMRVKNLRMLDYKKNVIPIKDRTGSTYKVYDGDSNWGIEIYARPPDFDKWQGVVISRFDANKSDFKPGTSFKPNPADRLIMRLRINDCVECDRPEGKKIMRLQKINQRGEMNFTEHYEANVDKRVRSRNFAYWAPRAAGLRSANARKVHISPTGRVTSA